MKKEINTLVVLFFSTFCFAQIPIGYYNSANGLKGQALRIALHDIIKDHRVTTYDSLYYFYQKTDKKSNGKVWDMYSDNPAGTPPYEYSFLSAQECGNYNSEADCFNREHSWPQSWFNSLLPMGTDLFHIYPTDGFVNGKRGNSPYGEVSNATWTSLNGAKVGNNTFPGFTGVVFEPINEYKGDLARSYFYVSTRYYNEDSGWANSLMTNKCELLPWAINLLIKWHRADPVSAKEIARNDSIYYHIQHNRNPYIDNPAFADSVWKSTATGLEVYSAVIDISIFPNPITADVLFFNGTDFSKIKSVAVYDFTGRLVIADTQLTNNTLSIAGLHKGIYSLSIQLTEGYLLNKKIVKVY